MASGDVRNQPKLPWQQLTILCLCRLAEPITLFSMFPYAYYMIKSFGIEKDDRGYWVGMMAASFSVTQLFTAILWGYVSDKIGRKPAILLGLFGTMISTLLFGFSKTLPMAIASRSLLGILNGNVGILRTMVAELVPQKQLQPRAFSLMPLTWSVGTILGPMLGGFLADPVRQYPLHFRKGGFWEKYPFALPNIATAILLGAGMLIGFLFLDETLSTKQNARDPGRVIGRKIVAQFCSKSTKPRRKSFLDESEASPLLANPGCADQDQTGLLGSPPSVRENIIIEYERPLDKSRSTFQMIFTFQSNLYLLLYFFIAALCVSFDQLLPVFMSTSPASFEPEFPFHFSGGLGLSESAVGLIIAISGVITLFSNFVVFPPLTARIGALGVMRLCVVLFPIGYFIIPYTLFFPQGTWQTVAIVSFAMIKWILGSWAFPVVIVLLTNSASDTRILGTLNGVATTISALGRTIGPAASGAFFSLGMKTEAAVIPWFVLGIVAIIGAIPIRWCIEGDGPSKHIAVPIKRHGDEHEQV